MAIVTFALQQDTATVGVCVYIFNSNIKYILVRLGYIKTFSRVLMPFDMRDWK